MICEISLTPVEDYENAPPRVSVTSKPPEETHHKNHPAFDNQISEEVEQAFQEEVPTHIQRMFLDEYDYPYQKPTVATVEWFPEKNLKELSNEISFTEKFRQNT